MCVIIDTNCLGSVFDSQSVNHHDFEPVFEWINNGKGKIVYGGTKYLKEIGKYASIFKQLRTAGRAVYIDCDRVDIETVNVSKIIEHKDFDDQHLVGLLKASGCKLICSDDARAYPFFTNIKFFSSKTKPKIYSSSANENILREKNIADICKPCRKATKAQKKIIKDAMRPKTKKR